MISRLSDIVAGFRVDLGQEADRRPVKCWKFECECDHRVCEAGWIHTEDKTAAPCKYCYPSKFDIWRSSRSRAEMLHRYQHQEKEKLPKPATGRSWR